MTAAPLPGVLASLGPALDHHGYLTIGGLGPAGGLHPLFPVPAGRPPAAILALIARRLARRRAARQAPAEPGR